MIDYDEDDKPYGAEFHNLTDIGTPAARWVIRGFQAAFVLAVVTLCWAPAHRPGGRQGVRFAAECSLIVVGMLLFSERTWKHHGVVLVVPFAMLAAFVTTRDLSAGMRGYVTWTLGLVAVLTLGPSLLGGDAQDLALTYGSHAAAFLLLAAACVRRDVGRTGYSAGRTPSPS